MKLSINTFQRIWLSNIVGAIEGRVQIVRKASKLLDLLELSEDEKKLVGLRQVSNGLLQWDDLAHVWGIEIADDNLATFLKDQVAAYNWPAGILASPSQRHDVNGLLDMLKIE